MNTSTLVSPAAIRHKEALRTYLWAAQPTGPTVALDVLAKPVPTIVEPVTILSASATELEAAGRAGRLPFPAVSDGNGGLFVDVDRVLALIRAAADAQ